MSLFLRNSRIQLHKRLTFKLLNTQAGDDLLVHHPDADTSPVKKSCERVASSLLSRRASGEHRPEKRQQSPLSIFTVLDESLCITITFSACLRASTSGRHEKKRKSERMGEERGWRVKYAPAMINVQQRNLPVALPWRGFLSVFVCVCADVVQVDRFRLSGWNFSWSVWV